MGINISSRQSQIFITALIKDAPVFSTVASELSAETDFLTIEDEDIAEVGMSADGVPLSWVKTGFLTITLTLSPVSKLYLPISGLINSITGFGDIHAIPKWMIVITYPEYKKRYSNGDLIKGTRAPNLGVGKYGELTYTFKFPNNQLDTVPL